MSEEHAELGFFSKYVFSTDHKTIGIQYGITALVFLFFGFSLMMMMRWQLAYPGQAIPIIGGWLGIPIDVAYMDPELTPLDVVVGPNIGAAHLPMTVDVSPAEHKP